MKKIFKAALSAVLSVMLCVTAAAIALPAGAALPDRPQKGDYTLKNSALQLTSGNTEATTSAASTGTRIAPNLKEASFDISNYDYLYLWIYVSDASLLSNNNGDGLELCSGGMQDSEESALYFHRTKESVPTINSNYSPLKTGWNEYMLKLEDFTVTKGGSLNASNLNFIGLVLRSTKPGLTFGISDIYAVKSGEFTAPTVSSSPSGSSDNTSSASGNGEGKVAFGVPLHDFAEGKATLSDGVLYLSSATKPSGAGKFAYLCVEVYLENIGSLSGNGSFFISSSSDAGKQELSGKLSKTTLKNGWNTVFLKIADFRMSGYDYDDPSYSGVCDLMNICRLGVSWNVSDEKAVIKLGKVTCTNSSSVPSNLEGKYKISSNAIPVTSEEIAVTVKASGKKELATLIPSVTNGSVDVTSKKYLYFWIYVSDVTLDGSDTTESLELSSSGTQDINENSIGLSPNGSSVKSLFGDFGELKNGWNEYLVPIDALSKVTNKTGALIGCDFTAVNFVRLYFRTVENTQGKSVTYKLSSVYAVNDEDLNGDEGLSLVSSEISTSSQSQNDIDGNDGKKGSAVIVYVAVAAAVAVVAAAVLFIVIKKKKTAPAEKDAESDTTN
ncbi:MAG: hypothetical protein IJY56_01445 [Clostridia bacterium]|nr:hypothetical protein [Clostridia bacterium]